MSGSGPNICYFSKKCRFCQAFLQELHQTPFMSEFRFFCVDPSPSRPPLPAWLKVVPTIVIAGESEPRTGPSEVNNWFFARKMLGAGGGGSGGGKSIEIPTYKPLSVKQEEARRAMPEPISSSTPANSKQGPPPSAAGDMGGIEAWHRAEMDGGNWSDGYSFVGDTFTAEAGMNPIIRNFESLIAPAPPAKQGGGGGRGGVGSAGFSGAAPRSAKEEKLLKDFEAFSKAREMEFAGPRRMG
jgi:hypothetical protein